MCNDIVVTVWVIQIFLLEELKDSRRIGLVELIADVNPAAALFCIYPFACSFQPVNIVELLNSIPCIREVLNQRFLGGNHTGRTVLHNINVFALD